MIVAKRHKRIVRMLENELLSEKPGLTLNLLNMINCWAEFKIENICEGFDDLQDIK